MKSSVYFHHIAEVFMFICSCIAGAIGYRNRKKHYYLKGLYLYPIASMVHTLLFYIIRYSHITWKIKSTIVYIGEDIFMFIEFFTIYNFYLKILNSQPLRKLLYLIRLFYVLAVLGLWIAYNNVYKFTINLYIIQTFSILIPISFYYLELIKKPPLDPLFQSAAFWTATGITVYFTCTTPLFLLKDFIFGDNHLIEHNLFLINYFSYGILFLFIAKAYLCPKREVQNNSQAYPNLKSI